MWQIVSEIYKYLGASRGRAYVYVLPRDEGQEWMDELNQAVNEVCGEPDGSRLLTYTFFEH